MAKDDPERQAERSTLVRLLADDGAIRTGVVRQAFLDVPRHCFVPAELQHEAYRNHALPIGCGQTISQPLMVAIMTELVAPGPDRRVLEIGTGSGYQAAILSRMCGRVYTVERIPELFHRSRELFGRLGYDNIVTRLDDGSVGWPEEGPFHDIVVTAGAPAVPASLKAQLLDGGAVIVPVGDGYFQTLLRVVRRGDEFVTETHGGCVFVRLIGREAWPGDLS